VRFGKRVGHIKSIIGIPGIAYACEETSVLTGFSPIMNDNGEYFSFRIFPVQFNKYCIVFMLVG